MEYAILQYILEGKLGVLEETGIKMKGWVKFVLDHTQ
jgi:hypothetical protein